MKEELRKIWEEYKREVLEEKKNPQMWYREKVWPVLLHYWKTSPVVEPRQIKFDVSIHTLGTSPEATILAILGTRAEEVHILHTPETRQYVSQIEEDANVRPYLHEIGKSDVVSIYKIIEELLEKNSEKSVALDVTSGTKAMSSGVAAAGFFFRRFFKNVRVVYIDNEEYDKDLRRPVAGAEKLIILPSPHEVLGDVDSLFALEHYQAGEFHEAQLHFREAAEKTKDRRYELFANLCVMYHALNCLDFEKAWKVSKKILEELREDVWLNHPINKFYGTIEQQGEAIAAVLELVQKKDFAKEKLGVAALAKTLLKVGERYCKEQQFVLAALHFYRALELLLQERLTLHGLSVEPQLSEEEKRTVRSLISKLHSKKEEEVFLPEKLGLFDIVILLKVRNDECVNRVFDEASLKNLSLVLQARNSSILIHGLDFPNGKVLDSLKSKAEKLLKDLESRLGITLDLDEVKLTLEHLKLW